MIHATWRKDNSTGRWGVFVKKDKFWGKEEPQPFDKVLVQARSVAARIRILIQARGVK